MSHLKPSAATKLSAPSPTPSNSSSGGPKRKRVDDIGSAPVYSQPQDTGTGNHIFTQVTYTIDFLRSKQRWVTLKEILDFLSLRSTENTYDQTIKSLIAFYQSNKPGNRIEYDNSKDKYRYKPKYAIRNAAELKGWLQNQKSAQGLSVKELKDGWPNVQEEIAELEKTNDILVNRHKKDGQAKTVWINDGSLMHKMDDQFKADWHKIPLPANPDDLRNKLVAAGLKPSSAPREATAAKPKEKKRKAPRRGGKQTNTHMASILQDYSHLRK